MSVGGPAPAAAAGGVPPVKGSDVVTPTDSIQGAAATHAHLDALNSKPTTDTDVAMKPAETQMQAKGDAGLGAGSDLREQKAASPVLPTVRRKQHTAEKCKLGCPELMLASLDVDGVRPRKEREKRTPRTRRKRFAASRTAALTRRSSTTHTPVLQPSHNHCPLVTSRTTGLFQLCKVRTWLLR